MTTIQLPSPAPHWILTARTETSNVQVFGENTRKVTGLELTHPSGVISLFKPTELTRARKFALNNS